MGCCQSKRHPNTKALTNSDEGGERQSLLNGASGPEDEGGYGKSREYNVSPLPVDSPSPGAPSDNSYSLSSSTDELSAKGREIMRKLKDAYRWRDEFNHPSQEFLSRMDHLYMECQLHLTQLSAQEVSQCRREADTIVNEMVKVRNYWGPQLLPSSVCNAFVRERISLTVGTESRNFRIDCAQFFEPVPFYGNQQGNPGELMKLYRFSVYDVAKNEVILRYYLERSNVIQLYHVLCYTLDSYRGQVHPYGSEQPTYWELRHDMLGDVTARIQTILQRGQQAPSPVPGVTPSSTPGVQPTNTPVL